MKKLLVLLLCLLPSVVFAQTIADVVAPLYGGGLKGVFDVLEGFSYVAGIGLAIKGVVKLREMSESRGQIKLHNALVFIIGGAFLVCLPALMSVGTKTLYGSAYNSSGGTTSSQY
jgi:integral membrane sensor domain MASE1